MNTRVPEPAVSPETVERAWSASYVQAALPLIEGELDKLFDLKMLGAFHRIKDKSLTPEQALTTLIELMTYRDLKVQLRSVVTRNL